jgi:hypothetical protein
MVSTPNAPDGCLFKRIEKEAEDTCIGQNGFINSLEYVLTHSNSLPW